ncbi:MAG: hypothetical protein RSB82_03715 [Victivallaceae bacterium]
MAVIAFVVIEALFLISLSVEKRISMFRIVVFALFSSSITNAETIRDNSGNKYITLGEVLGMPTQVQYSGRTWWYGSSYIDFNDKEENKEYSGGNQLKIRLLPKNKSKD